MSEKGPLAESPRAHCHVRPLTAPSMSVTAAVNSSPPDSVPVIVTVPSSSTLVTLTVTMSVALIPSSSSTFTVTL